MCLVQNQVFPRRPLAAPEAESAVGAPHLDPDQLPILAAQYQAHPQQPPTLPKQLLYPPHPSDPSALTPPGRPYQSPKAAGAAAGPSGQALQSQGNQATNNWLVADVAGDGRMSAVDPRMSALLAAIQGQVMMQNMSGCAAPAQVMSQAASYDVSTPQETAAQQQQDTQHQHEQSSTEPVPTQQQQQHQQQGVLQLPADLHGQLLANQSAQWPGSATMQALQQLLQQSRAPRPWAVSQVIYTKHSDHIRVAQECYVGACETL